MNNIKNRVFPINIIKSTGIFYFLIQSFLFAQTAYYVNGTGGNDSNNCTSVSTPCLTIQAAINKTSDGDEVIVSVGHYIENLIIETGIELQAADSSNPPTIDGSAATDDFGSCINIRENASGDFRGTVEVEGMILTGGKGTRVKIQDLNTDGDYDDVGESIIVGGGIRSQNVNLVSKKNKFVNNGTSVNIDKGGGYYIGDAPDIDQNDPRTPTSKNNNDSREDILILFEETEFSGNQAEVGGAGVFVDNSADSTNLFLSFDHVTIADNDGGGIYASNFVPGNAITITNSILWDNYPFSIYVGGQGFALSFTYTDIDMSVEGQGNINYNPRFVNPQEGDFTLQESSPCIDAGDPDSGWDPDGTEPDMGAYYYDQGTSGCEEGYVDDCSGDGDCCPESWIGDGFVDCEDQTYGCDLTCYDNDGGDCGFVCGDGYCDYEQYENEDTCPEDCWFQCNSGDANEDGILNILDVVMVVGFVLTGEGSGSCMDMNQDGIINVLDVVALVNIILNS